MINLPRRPTLQQRPPLGSLSLTQAQPRKSQSLSLVSLFRSLSLVLAVLAAVLAVTAVITGSALADNGPLKIALFQQQLTNGAPQVVADALALEAEQNPTSPHIQYNAGVAAYAAHR